MAGPSIELRVPDGAGPAWSDARLRPALESATAGLLGDLGLPPDAALRITAVPSAALRHRGRFDILIDGRHGRVRMVPRGGIAQTPPDDVAEALLANRALFVNDTVAARVAAELAAGPPDGSDPAALPLPRLAALLSRCAGFGLSLGTAKRAARHLARVGFASADDAEHAALATLFPRVVTVEVAPLLYAEWAGLLAPESGGVTGIERQLRDEVFEALGLTVPGLEFQATDDLPDRSVRLRLHEIRGAIRVVPPDAYGAPPALAVVVGAELRAQASLLLTPGLAEATLRRFGGAPMLVFNALERYPLCVLAQALRGLLAEQVSIRNLRAILDAWNGLRGVSTAERDGTVALAVSKAPICPPVAPGDGRDTPIDARHLAGAARIALRGEITRDVAPGNELLHWVLAPGLVAQLRRENGEPDDETYAGLLAQVHEAVTSPDRPAVPVLLVPPSLRPAVAASLSAAFPDLRVLSPLELDPAVEKHRLGQIGTTAA